MNLLEFSAALDGFFWGPIIIYLCLGAGIFFSVIMKFPQLRLIKDMVGQLIGGKASESGVSSFQGFAMALGGRVGTGNITGVASAILFGGPGAVFWMWLIAFLGAGSAFIESSLAQVWKEQVNGEYRGGPAYYMEKGLKSKSLGILFAVLTVASIGIMLPGLQSNSFAVVGQEAFGISPIMTGILFAGFAALVIFGGGKRIAKTAEIIVPFMAIAYIVIALLIFFANFTMIPQIFSMILTSAFSTNAVFGAIFGNAVSWGVKRGVFSNEAGLGTGAQAAGSAEVSHPAKQGLVQAFSVYVDTLFVCTATAFMMLSTNSFNVADPANANGFLVEYLPGVGSGNFTQMAVDSFIPGFGSIFIALAMLLFTFTTVLAYAFYSDSCIAYLFKNNAQGVGYKYGIMAGRIGICVMTFLGAISTPDLVWNFGSAFCGMMAVQNVICILFLTKPGIATLKDYEAQKKLGLDPVFIPSRCGIQGAELWEEIIPNTYPEQYSAYQKTMGIVKKKIG